MRMFCSKYAYILNSKHSFSLAYSKATSNDLFIKMIEHYNIDLNEGQFAIKILFSFVIFSTEFYRFLYYRFFKYLRTLCLII